MIGTSLRPVARWLSRQLGNPRIYYDRAGTSPYLSRWFIAGKPHMPDGSEPFDAHGNKREGAVESSRPWELYLHRFHRSDDDGELHNHPWRWAISFVLAGGYSEERRVDNRVVRRPVRPLSINVLSGDTFHRVDLLEGDAWSIFLVGPRTSEWGFWNRVTGQFSLWQEFIARKRGARVG